MVIIINYILLLFSSIDTLFIILAHSLKKIKLNIFNISIISLISSLTLFLSMLISKFILKYISLSKANIIASIILLLMGVFNVLLFLIKKKLKNLNENKKVIKFETSDIHFIINIFLEKEDADINNDLSLSFKETIILSIILSLDSVSTGIALGLYGVNIFLMFFVSFILQLFFSILGIFLAKYIKKEKDYSLISGLLFIIIAILKIFI